MPSSTAKYPTLGNEQSFQPITLVASDRSGMCKRLLDDDVLDDDCGTCPTRCRLGWGDGAPPHRGTAL